MFGQIKDATLFPQTSMITYIQNGDIFESTSEALVNPVNTVGVMGKGLASVFKRRFPQNFKVYEKACREGDFDVGEVLSHFEKDAVSGQMRWVVNFPTKHHWRDSSKLEWIELGLQGLRSFLNVEGIASVAIPALGCGLGSLDWEDVKDLIEAELDGLDVEIFVYEPISEK